MNQRQITILTYLKENPESSSSDIHRTMVEKTSLVTVKRELAELLQLNLIKTRGGGRSVRYVITTRGRLFLPIDARAYNKIDLDARAGVIERYHHTLWNEITSPFFSSADTERLQEATNVYLEKSSHLTPDAHKKELERFVIELSWKSSRIEGNTYTLLDTELLLKEGIVSEKNTEEEARMIVNHKIAFEFTLQQKKSFKHELTIAHIDTVHQLLTQYLLHDTGLRKSAVGITGSRYVPLDNQHQIREALEALLRRVNDTQSPYEKAFLALTGISYIQPFVDGNKRTARLVANALLMAHECAPLSYRSVDEVQYREALMVFYEQLSLIPMKELFVEQYVFAAHTYTGIG